MSTILITGGAGFVASNLAHRLLDDGHRVRVLDDLSRPGVEENLRWLAQTGGDRLDVSIGDVCDEDTVASALAGRAFNIGGGPDNAVSLRDVIALSSALCDAVPSVSYDDWRTGDQRWYVSDTAAFRRATGWKPQTAPREGLAGLRAWLADAPLIEPATIR